MYAGTTGISLAAAVVGGAAVIASVPAQADTVVYLVNRHAIAAADRVDRRLQSAAPPHTNDIVGNRALNGDIGSDRTTPKGVRRC
jgi:hypothetical protein